LCVSVRVTRRLRTRRSGCIVAFAISSTPTAQQRTLCLPPAALLPPFVSLSDRLSLSPLSTPLPQPTNTRRPSPPSFGTHSVTRCPSSVSLSSPSPAPPSREPRENSRNPCRVSFRRRSYAATLCCCSAVSPSPPPQNFSENTPKSFCPPR